MPGKPNQLTALAAAVSASKPFRRRDAWSLLDVEEEPIKDDVTVPLFAAMF
jgi:hypothetical protein